MKPHSPIPREVLLQRSRAAFAAMRRALQQSEEYDLDTSSESRYQKVQQASLDLDNVPNPAYQSPYRDD